MNHEKALQYYASVLDDDLTIGANHLLDDLPTTFTATDFLYFFALRDRFWSDVADEEEPADDERCGDGVLSQRLAAHLFR